MENPIMNIAATIPAIVIDETMLECEMGLVLGRRKPVIIKML
jgi:hypothetical protein